MKRLREALTIAALAMIILAGYAFMQWADAEAAEREQAASACKADQ
ncbi:hypothetical protein GJ699_02335 [Duganella sp. FT80W]|uniref:Uncharacterized protein n=1 Tax=Duganella guangzhouensis TaxID=2666084 RepID=A0A6I2KSU7_9BURK|nr:hypothetical protein [Duganella guangzhouensis]MRW88818.1 hypothetical protein [Duganella guangzhouensis]